MAIRPVNLPVLPLEEPAKQLAAFLTNEAQTSFGCNAIPSDWMQKWIHFAEQDTMKIPPMINTTSLIGKVPTGIVAPGQLASFLTVDYVFIEERIWSYLTARYGLQGPAFHCIYAPLDRRIQMSDDMCCSTYNIDVSLLIDYPHLKFDLDLTHTLSGMTWNLPSQALAPHGLLASTLVTLVKDSIFPKSSIDALIRYLCLQRGLQPSCLALSHITRMFSQLGLDVSRPLNDLKLALDNTPHDVALQDLFDVWEDRNAEWNLDDTIIHLLVAKIREKPVDNDFFELTFPRMSKHLYPLLMLVSSSSALKTCPVLVPSTWSPDAPQEHSSQSALHPQAILNNPWDFLFLFDVEERGTCAISDSLVLLLPQWLWIRHMFSSGCSESKSRVAHMPRWMTRKVLLAILYSLRGELVVNLDKEDAMIILKHASELNLCSVEYEPVEPFTQLLASSNELCFSKLTKLNCFGQLELSHHLRMQRKTEEILAFIADSLTTLIGSEVLQLSPELYTLVWAYVHPTGRPRM